MDRIERSKIARRAAVLGASAALSAAVAAPIVRASSPPAPSAGASAAAAASLPVIRGSDVPAEASKEPKGDEWKEGKEVRPHRGALERCKLRLVREWLRVTCKEWVGASLVAGDKEGVKMSISGDRASDQNPLTVTVVTPLRRGSAQVFTFLDFSFGYDSVSLGEGGAMSVLWREGHEDPAIVIGVLPD